MMGILIWGEMADNHRPDDKVLCPPIVLLIVGACLVIALISTACTYVGVQIKERGLWG